MQEIEFRNWLIKNGTRKKVLSDIISRLKRLERAMVKVDTNFKGIDIAYKTDKCELVLSIFEKTGRNPVVDNLGYIDLPIGKYSLSTFKYSLKKYIMFLQVKENEN